ncbi:MAG: sigma-70 family RNA polymerase sigma factor [Thermoguttaceae bacterium]
MEPNEPSVECLIAQCRKEPAALGRLLERYRAILHLAAEAQIGPKLKVRCDASDLVQHTLIDAQRDFPAFAGSTEPEFSAWIKRIHRRNLADAIKRHVHAAGRTVLREEPLLDPRSDSVCMPLGGIVAVQSTPSQHVIKAERALRLAEILLSLPEVQRRAICMRHMEGLKLDAIAEELGRSVGSVAGLIDRGLTILRKTMSEQSWT